MDAIEKKLPVRNLERIISKSYKSYEDADFQRKVALDMSKPGSVAKAKIFARYDGTFDLVLYKKIQAIKVDVGSIPPEQAGEVIEKVKQKIHGQKSKDRKKDPRKK